MRKKFGLNRKQNVKCMKVRVNRNRFLESLKIKESFCYNLWGYNVKVRGQKFKVVVKMRKNWRKEINFSDVA